jgi:hypothetical protein
MTLRVGVAEGRISSMAEAVAEAASGWLELGEAMAVGVRKGAKRVERDNIVTPVSISVQCTNQEGG